MYNWQKIKETNQYKYLLKKDVDVPNSERLELLWSKIYDEFIAEFGISSDYQKLLRKKRQIALLKAEFISKEDRVLINFINVEENMLKQMYKGMEQQISFRENLIRLEKKQGFKMDSKKITVADYYNYLRSFKDE